MKTLLILCAFLSSLTALHVSAQESEEMSTIESRIPYGKMMGMSDEELLNQNFKFNKEKNQYTLRKKNGLRVAASILGAVADNPTNYIPDVHDYEIIIQKGKTGVSYIEVTFYDAELYRKIMTFAKDDGRNQLDTNTGLSDKIQFDYDKYSFTIAYSTKTQSSAQSTTRDNNTRWSTAKEYSSSTSKDESYNIYVFTIHTGIEPSSEYISKQQAKSQKKDAKGKKKQSAADFM